MTLFLLSLLAITLVVLLIKALHVLQLRKAREVADQSAPLPPLPDDDNQPRPGNPPGIVAALPVQAATGAWQDEVKALRDAGQFSEALALCNRQYPKMLAFRQTLITLRSQLKTGHEEPEQSLPDIYRTALLADLAKSTRELADSTDDIMAQLPEIQDPRQYWAHIGYEKLDLLTKTDRNLLIQHWGEPDTHHHVSTLQQSAARDD